MERTELGPPRRCATVGPEEPGNCAHAFVFACINDVIVGPQGRQRHTYALKHRHLTQRSDVECTIAEAATPFSLRNAHQQDWERCEETGRGTIRNVPKSVLGV